MPSKSKGKPQPKQTPKWLGGCATALVTPFGPDNALDLERLDVLAARQLDNGVRILVPCGTTGESATMTEEEDQQVIERTVRAAKRHKKGGFVIAGTGSNSTADAVRYALTARAIGADAVLVVAPFYNKPTQEGLYQHFRTVAEAVAPLPVMLYNVPGRTSSNISAATVLRLAREVENVVAVKEASGNFAQVMEIVRERPPGFRVFSGDDALTLPLAAVGAEGVVSVASNVMPKEMGWFVGGLNKYALSETARRMHYRLLPLMEALFIETSPAPVKALMAMMGLLEENLRLPLVPVGKATRERLRAVLAELKLPKETKYVIKRVGRGAGRARRERVHG